MPSTVTAELAETKHNAYWAVPQPEQQAKQAWPQMFGGSGLYQYSGDNERLVCQRLWDIDVQAGGVHCQGVVGVPDPNLAEKENQHKIKAHWWINNVCSNSTAALLSGHIAYAP